MDGLVYLISSSTAVQQPEPTVLMNAFLRLGSNVVSTIQLQEHFLQLELLSPCMFGHFYLWPPEGKHYWVNQILICNLNLNSFPGL